MSARPVSASNPAVSRPAASPRAWALAIAATLVFVVTWLLRYADPGNELGGLLDDHFFYAVPGWQILYGELPDRDFVDAGAPLTYAVSALLQLALGHSIWSEFIFCVTALSVGTALTCVLAARASGSIILGVLAAALQTALIPRLYNYPKIVVYSVAIAAIWAWVARPRVSRTWLVALIAVVSFLMRHDHGVYVALGFGFAILGMRDFAWSQRIRHGLIFSAAMAMLLTPYLVYLQVNGGILRHFTIAYRWSTRDYERAPLVLPTLTMASLSAEEPNDAPPSEWWNHAPFPALSEYYYEWSIYWLMMLLPLVALVLLVSRPAHGPPAWPQERAKMLAVIAIGAVLDFRFLRGNLEGRFADASVPFAILAVWTFATALATARSGRIGIGTSPRVVPVALRGLVALIALTVAGITALLLLRPSRELIENSRMLEGTEALRGRIADVTDRLQHTWPLPADYADGRSGAVQLALYLQECTSPTDRVLVTSMMPQVVGLADRGFAGGQIDLRAGFHDSVEEQQLTLERLKPQSVPVVIGPPRDEMRDYAESLPLISAYLNREYVNLGDKELRGGLVVSLMVSRHARTVRTYAPLEFPCFR